MIHFGCLFKWVAWTKQKKLKKTTGANDEIPALPAVFLVPFKGSSMPGMLEIRFHQVVVVMLNQASNPETKVFLEEQLGFRVEHPLWIKDNYPPWN